MKHPRDGTHAGHENSNEKEKKRKLFGPSTARKFDSDFKTAEGGRVNRFGREVTFKSLYGAIGKTSFLVHGLGDGDVDFLSIVEVCLDFVADFAFRDLDIVLGRPFSSHQVKKIVINIDLGIISHGTRAIEVRKRWIPIDIQFWRRWGHPCCGWKGRDLHISFE